MKHYMEINPNETFYKTTALSFYNYNFIKSKQFVYMCIKIVCV